MEATAGLSRGGLAGCSFHQEDFVSFHGLETKNVEFKYEKCFHRRTRIDLAVRSTSAQFEDLSHEHFYFKNKIQQERREGLSVHGRRIRGVGGFDRGAALVCTAVPNDEDDLISHYAGIKKAAKHAKKLAKKLLEEAKGGSSSSSSESSSESGSESEMVITKRRSRKRGNFEQMKKDWDSMSQSALFNSIPDISGDFWFGQSQAAQLSLDLQENSVVQQEHAVDQREDSIVEERAHDASSFSATSRSSSSFASDDNNTFPILVAGVSIPRDVRMDTSNFCPLLASASGSSATADVQDSLSRGRPRVEVCMGGKCKRAGAEQVLSAFQENGVQANCANKCMKNCKAAINIRIQESKFSQPIMHSGIGLGDVNVLSQEYFGVRTPGRLN